MALSEAQLKARDGKITASFTPYLMAGDQAKIMREWRRLVGDPAYEPEDLSANWPVQLGSYLESFALDWHQTKTGKTLTQRGEVVTHPAFPFVCCTLDAWCQADDAVIDCKVLGNWRKIDEACQFYVPQLIVQKACTGADNASLLIVHGGAEPVECPLTWGAEYEALVWARIHAFWRLVEDLTAPYDMPAAAPNVQPVKTYDMGESNEWGFHAADWLGYRDSARKFKSAESGLKKLVPDDAVRCHGKNVLIRRNKAGALSISEGE